MRLLVAVDEQVGWSAVVVAVCPSHGPDTDADVKVEIESEQGHAANATFAALVQNARSHKH